MKTPLIQIFTLLFFVQCSSQKPAEYALRETQAYASCTDLELTKNGEPFAVSQEVRDALKCPVIVDLNQHWLTYMHENSVKQIHLDTQESQTLFQVYEDIDGISGPFWSPDETKMAFVFINQEMKHGYEAMTRIMVLTLDENRQIVDKQKFDKIIFFECGGTCWADVEFTDNNTLKYRDIQDKEEETAEPHFVLFSLTTESNTDAVENKVIALLQKYPQIDLDKYAFIIEPTQEDGFAYYIRLGYNHPERFETVKHLFVKKDLQTLYEMDIYSAEYIEVQPK